MPYLKGANPQVGTVLDNAACALASIEIKQYQYAAHNRQKRAYR